MANDKNPNKPQPKDNKGGTVPFRESVRPNSNGGMAQDRALVKNTAPPPDRRPTKK